MQFQWSQKCFAPDKGAVTVRGAGHLFGSKSAHGLLKSNWIVRASNHQMFISLVVLHDNTPFTQKLNSCFSIVNKMTILVKLGRLLAHSEFII